MVNRKCAEALPGPFAQRGWAWNETIGYYLLGYMHADSIVHKAGKVETLRSRAHDERFSILPDMANIFS